jgi:predicted NAD/FAD-binding protein
MGIKKQSIAIIGSGISGLSACWLLHKKYDVTLFEKNDYLGGHTHTHDVIEKDKYLAIDSGFIVYNKKNYPNLVGLLKQLDVETQTTDMSFAFSLDKGLLEYAGTGLSGMFAQRSNLLRPKHWRLLKEIVRFNKVAHAELKRLEVEKCTNYSLGDFLKQYKFSIDLQQNYLLPMGAAIWSCPVDVMYSFPAFSFLRFFANHGLIDLKNRPQWRSVVGGSREYIKKMMLILETEISIKGGAELVKRSDNCTKNRSDGVINKYPDNAIDQSSNKVSEHSVEVISDGQSYYFDQVVFACHADDALKLLDVISTSEEEILGCFTYQENKTYLHTDISLMPKRESAWCCWNYLAQSNNNSSSKRSLEDKQVTATYWMNKLQSINADKHYLVTLNPYQKIDQSKILKKMTYHHPVFDSKAINAQTRLNELQGINNSWFCGSYTGYGFHEDGLSSSVNVCEQLGVIAEWNITSGISSRKST